MEKKLKDLELGKYSQLITIYSKEQEYENPLDFYTDMLVVFTGKSVDELDSLSIEEFKLLCAEFNNEFTNLVPDEFYTEYTLGETTYHIKNKDTVKITTKEFKLLQKYIGQPDYISYLAAIIFDGDEDIEVRKDLFKEHMSIKYILHFILKISEYLVK